MLDVRRNRSSALRRDEVHRAHAAALRSVDVDIKIVADEQHLIEFEVKRAAHRLEDRDLGFALTMFVREDHHVEVTKELQLLEDDAQRRAGSAAGVADESQRVLASQRL